MGHQRHQRRAGLRHPDDLGIRRRLFHLDRHRRHRPDAARPRADRPRHRRGAVALRRRGRGGTCGPRARGMTIVVFLVSLLGAMAIGAPVAFALMFCGIALMTWMGIFNTQIVAQNMIAGADTFTLLAIPFFLLAGEVMNAGGLSRRIVEFAISCVGHIRGGLGIVAQNMIAGADTFTLLAIPFFLLAGEVMNAGGLSRRIVEFAISCVGHIRGGLGIVAIIAAVIMASLSGSAAADTAALAAILIPMMRDAGYNVPRSAGLMAAGGVIAPVIPPSIAFIIFGVAANVSITQLFMGGIAPGLYMAIALLVTWMVVARRDKVVTLPRQSWAQLRHATGRAGWALGMPIIVLGGIRFGLFTPTE